MAIVGAGNGDIGAQSVHRRRPLALARLRTGGIDHATETGSDRSNYDPSPFTLCPLRPSGTIHRPTQSPFRINFFVFKYEVLRHFMFKFEKKKS